MASVYSVSQVNSYIRHLFEEDFALGVISIKGEISNCKYHSSGHIYFTLKDEGSSIAAVMFARDAAGLKERLSDGLGVIATGAVNVYERDGRYQLYVKKIERDGQGDLAKRFEALKQELLEMGMFDVAYKKLIPFHAETIGIVTSPTGAAIRDIMNIAGRRNPYVQLYLYPALVQGTDAAESIAKGIRKLDSMGLDVLIVGRGGGSVEDLWAFNEEEVARAIFACETPVISAVGHETDYTIADFVADMRAPTPSAAAELSVFDYAEYMETVNRFAYSLGRNLKEVLGQKKSRLEQYRLRLEQKNPSRQLDEQRKSLELEVQRMRDILARKQQFEKHRLHLAIERLNGFSPLKKLESGYSYVSNEAGKNIKSVKQVSPGEQLEIYVKDGKIKAEVVEVSDGKRNHD